MIDWHAEIKNWTYHNSSHIGHTTDYMRSFSLSTYYLISSLWHESSLSFFHSNHVCSIGICSNKEPYFQSGLMEYQTVPIDSANCHQRKFNIFGPKMKTCHIEYIEEYWKQAHMRLRVYQLFSKSTPHDQELITHLFTSFDIQVARNPCSP